MAVIGVGLNVLPQPLAQELSSGLRLPAGTVARHRCAAGAEARGRAAGAGAEAVRARRPGALRRRLPRGATCCSASRSAPPTRACPKASPKASTNKVRLRVRARRAAHAGQRRSQRAPGGLSAMRTLVALLLLANLGFFALAQGWLQPYVGLATQHEREPQRLAAQIHPESVRVRAAGRGHFRTGRRMHRRPDLSASNRSRLPKPRSRRRLQAPATWQRLPAESAGDAARAAVLAACGAAGRGAARAVCRAWWQPRLAPAWPPAPRRAERSARLGGVPAPAASAPPWPVPAARSRRRRRRRCWAT